MIRYTGLQRQDEFADQSVGLNQRIAGKIANMPRFKLTDLFVLTAIVAAGIAILRSASAVYRTGDLIFSPWLYCGGAFVLFAAPVMYWGSICRRGKTRSVRNTIRRLNFWSAALLVITLFSALSYFGAGESGFAPGWRIGPAILTIVAGLVGGTLGTIAQRLKKHEYWASAPPHSWTPRSDVADADESEPRTHGEH
jgi:hypothetical protein